MSTPHFSILKSVQYDPQFFKKYSHSICDIDFIEKWIWITYLIFLPFFNWTQATDWSQKEGWKLQDLDQNPKKLWHDEVKP